jgi:hypothetical protein
VVLMSAWTVGCTGDVRYVGWVHITRVERVGLRAAQTRPQHSSQLLETLTCCCCAIVCLLAGTDTFMCCAAGIDNTYM